MKAGVETPRRTGFEGGSRFKEIRAGKSDSEGEMYREKAFRSVHTASGVDARHGSAGHSRRGGRARRRGGSVTDSVGRTVTVPEPEHLKKVYVTSPVEDDEPRKLLVGQI